MMQSVSCSLCNRTFSRHDNWKRHHRLFHGSNQPYPPPPPPRNQPYPPPFERYPKSHGSSQPYPLTYGSNQPPPPPPHGSNQPYAPISEVIWDEPFKFKHPFTMIVAGPTMSGKTTWMKTLLLNRNDVITPPPDRIVWIYKRWQPLYDELQLHIPEIQFIQNLPSKIYDDAFFYTRVRTFVIMDDTMKDATENKDVCEMFIEGAHHRNLSVACIMQNLFNKGKGNRLMNLNTQYLVVFKNPRDQLQITALARQMFPGNSKKLMDAYERAVQKPHGSLLIDFKLSTPESHRLRPNVLYSITKSDPKGNLDTKTETGKNNPFDHTDTDVMSSYDTESDVDDDLEESYDDTIGFDLWINEIWEKRDPEFQTKVSDMISAGALEDTAREHIRKEMMEADRELLLDIYSDFLRRSFLLMNCTLHKKIRHSILCQVNLNDMKIEDAISRILNNHKHNFNVLFNEND